MTEQALFPLTFEDVAIYFSEQEWRDLEGWQKELYKHVMRANYETLVSLDDGLPKPELISWIEQESEPFGNWEESHKSGSIICSSADLHFDPLTDQELFGRSQQGVDSGEAKSPHLCLDPLQSQHSFGPFLGEREAAPCRPSHGVTLRNPQKHDTWALTLTRHSSSESTQTERIPGLGALSPPGLQEVPFWESAQHPCPLCGPNFWKKNHSVTQQRSYLKNPPHRAWKKLSKRAGAQPQWNPLRVQRHFWCHECGRSFCPRQHLLKHLAAHPGWGPCCGPACQMCCYQPVHSREKPSQGLRCLLVNSTQVHQSQHGGERPSPRREGHQALSDLHSGQTLGLGLGCEECCPQEGGTETLKSSHGRERPCSGLESGKCFPTRAQLTRQHTVRTGATPFKCPECNRCFYLRGRLQVSLHMHSRERPCCRKCGKDFSRWCQLTEHVRVHSSEKPFWCATCGRDFRQRGQLLRHQRLHSDEKPFQCPECGLSFRLQSMLRAHRLRHGGQRPFSCSECGRGFTHPCKLREHLRVHSGERPFQCPECDKRFRLKGVLKAHQRTHSTERPFSCRECGKGFTRQSKLTEHFRLHSGERPFQCAECDRSFRLRGQLLSHQRLHTGERPFQCPECDKSYRVKADMKAHLLQHRGEMPFSCECGKGFAKQSKLTEHIRTHTGEKPFQCPQCDKSFRLKAQLLSHQGLHTGERPFHCPECNKSFRERGHVLRHQRIHRPERPFSCGDCGKGFIYKSKLAEHVRVHTKARRAPEEPDMKKRLSQLIAMIEADWS